MPNVRSCSSVLPVEASSPFVIQQLFLRWFADFTLEKTHQAVDNVFQSNTAKTFTRRKSAVPLAIASQRGEHFAPIKGSSGRVDRG